MKIGFVMYFDNCRMLRDLPDEQYAAVMRGLMEYAERLAEGREEELYLEQQKSVLSREVAMALDFMAGSVRRDHERYLETIERRGRKKTSGADAERMKYGGELQKTSRRSAGGQQLDDAWNYVGDAPRKQTNSLILDEEMMKWI